MIGSLKKKVILNAKNLIGWRTKRKIVVISVDDYGNVRLDSKKAREAMNREGLKVMNRFDALDTLETREDLEMLFEALQSVKGKNGRHAVFTPFAMPCNINFERIAETGYSEYHYELLPQTFDKLAELQPKAYRGVWRLWKEGIGQGLLVPQFHGREHLNLKLLEEKMAKRDHAVITALMNRSYTSIPSEEYQTISPTAAFDFWDLDENKHLGGIIEDGLNKFEQVFGYRPVHFTPPVYNIHPQQYSLLKNKGVKYIDTALLKHEHQGKGKYKKVFNYTGKKNTVGQTFLVRNVVFEPTDNRGVDWVNYTMEQIAAAFRWNRPAIISSHRVNFCGHIEPANREKGIDSLTALLKEIVKRWPEVEFMAANELGDLVAGMDGSN